MQEHGEKRLSCSQIRECLHWRGDPHLTMGELPSQMVRETAQQVGGLLEADEDG